VRRFTVSNPEIQIVVGGNSRRFDRYIFYKEYLNQFNDHVVLTSRFDHEISYVGGCPPIETAHGWLLIYHGVKDGLTGYIYSACAALT
jgi:predicted GH43/DUF377 family glycosyl hydrolase